MNIVVVDDESMIREVVSDIVETDTDNRVVGRASSADEAQQMYQDLADNGTPVHIGIIDGLNGRVGEVIDHQGRFFPESKTIVLSGEEQECGDAILRKPDGVSELLTTIRELSKYLSSI
ncbi:response regulator transcription factor [Patescibacteria group bacterium]|nr:response regulator transcription factor [Patescibacteria group bacterium]